MYCKDKFYPSGRDTDFVGSREQTGILTTPPKRLPASLGGEKKKSMKEILENIFAVEVPKGTTSLTIMKITERKYDLVQGHISGYIGNMRLPEGNWESLFTTKDCTEEQAAGIVEKCARGWKDYFDDPYANIPFSTAEYSLKSLLRSHGLDTNKNYLLLTLKK